MSRNNHTSFLISSRCDAECKPAVQFFHVHLDSGAVECEDSSENVGKSVGHEPFLLELLIIDSAEKIENACQIVPDGVQFVLISLVRCKAVFDRPRVENGECCNRLSEDLFWLAVADLAQFIDEAKEDLPWGFAHCRFKVWLGHLFLSVVNGYEGIQQNDRLIQALPPARSQR